MSEFSKLDIEPITWYKPWTWSKSEVHVDRRRKRLLPVAAAIGTAATIAAAALVAGEFNSKPARPNPIATEMLNRDASDFARLAAQRGLQECITLDTEKSAMSPGNQICSTPEDPKIYNVALDENGRFTVIPPMHQTQQD